MKNVLFFSICLASAIAGCSTISTKEYPTLERAEYACNAWKDRGTLYIYMDKQERDRAIKSFRKGIERLTRIGPGGISDGYLGTYESRLDWYESRLRAIEQSELNILDYDSTRNGNWVNGLKETIHSRKCFNEGSRYVGYANEVLEQGAVGISVLDIGEYKAKRYFDVETD